MARRPSRRRRIAPPAPRGFPRGYLAEFSAEIDPHVARKVQEYVQRNCIDRTRYMTVDVAVGLIADELGVCKWKGYKFLRAGRWLAKRRRNQ